MTRTEALRFYLKRAGALRAASVLLADVSIQKLDDSRIEDIDTLSLRLREMSEREERIANDILKLLGVKD